MLQPNSIQALPIGRMANKALSQNSPTSDSTDATQKWALRVRMAFLAIGGQAATFALVGVVLAMSSGCSTHATRLRKPRQAFYGNQLQQAHTQLEELAEDPKGDASVVELDLALVDLFSGDAATAEGRLRAVRDSWDFLEQKSLAEQATALLTDDQRRKYSGEDYEKLLVRVFLTLTSLMQDGVDAESYSLQTLAKQEELASLAKQNWGEEEVPDNYCIPAVAPYLRGVLREATFANYDDAARGLPTFIVTDARKSDLRRGSTKGDPRCA